MATRVVVLDGVKYVPVVSRRFICPKCNIFCMELTPVYHKGMKFMAGAFPQVKVYCKNGCHLNPDWGWKDFNWQSIRARDSIKDWPERPVKCDFRGK